MTYLCPVCSSSAVELAGRTDTYQSLVCRNCDAWTTIPVPPPRPPPEPGTAPEPGRRPAWEIKIK